MTTYTEPYRDYEALLYAEPEFFEAITLVSGAGVVEPNTVLGKITTGTTATATAFSGNTGNGTMGTITVSAGAVNGTYKLVIIEPATDAGKFQVEDPNGKIIGTGAVAAAFSKGGLAFTLADGATDFAAGDGFDIVVASGSGKYTPYDDALTNGAQTAVAVCLQGADATSGDKTVTALVRIGVIKKDALQWHTDVDSTAKAKAYVDLQAANIIAR
jgi:hypothetical protein